MVEIFKTNVTDPKLANEILKGLASQFPELQFNFDLEDCDQILRIEGNICLEKIRNSLNSFGIDFVLID